MQSGYECITGSDPAFANYLRSLPLKPKGSPVMYYTGGKARLQSLAYAVADMPLLSNDEQCADCCMRLRGEYLYQTGQYGRIRFTDVNGNSSIIAVVVRARVLRNLCAGYMSWPVRPL